MMNSFQVFILSTTVLIVSLASSFTTQPRFITYPALKLSSPSSLSSASLIRPFSLNRVTSSSSLTSGFREFRRSALAAVDDEAPPSSLTSNDDSEENDDNEWDYEEYEDLVEADFYNSEWKVGTIMDGDPSSNKKIEIVETWCRLLVEDVEQGIGKGQVQRCIWGDGKRGKWNFDRGSQFLSLTKDTYGGWLGKKIWAGTVTDFYYLQGSVRGWSPISPASVVGQWQAKRLGVDKGEAGTAPWFEEVNEVVEDGVEEEAPQLESSVVDDGAEVEAETPQLVDSIQDKDDAQTET